MDVKLSKNVAEDIFNIYILNDSYPEYIKMSYKLVRKKTDYTIEKQGKKC